MNETNEEENNIKMTSTQLEPVALYNIYSNISKTVLGKIYLTNTQRDILTKAFQHRGTYHQDLALLIVQE